MNHSFNFGWNLRRVLKIYFSLFSGIENMSEQCLEHKHLHVCLLWLKLMSVLFSGDILLEPFMTLVFFTTNMANEQFDELLLINYKEIEELNLADPSLFHFESILGMKVMLLNFYCN